MDRSFLSKAAVIAASRQFVCVRLATYESAEEADFLKTVTPTRSGEVENTVFTILSPDGSRQLVRGSRSAREAFRDADQMAATMNRIAGWYSAKGSSDSTVPVVANVRLGVDIAACDNQPLVVVYSEDVARRKALVDRLAALAWTNDFRGRFIYAEAYALKDLQMIDSTGAASELLVVQPDRFGQKGSVLARAPIGASSDEMARCLRDGVARHRRQTETFQSHIRDGRRQDVFWETAIPVTDPEERAVRERRP
jgi:hypothetical protein